VVLTGALPNIHVPFPVLVQARDQFGAGRREMRVHHGRCRSSESDADRDIGRVSRGLVIGSRGGRIENQRR
jgi:hypothetical protein